MYSLPSLTLHLRIFHQQQEAVSEGGADRLCPGKEQVEGGELQVLEVKLCSWVVFFLKSKSK